MASSLIPLQVTSDHPIPIGPPGETFTVTVAAGTIFYADYEQVSATNNLGSIAAGSAVTFANPIWVIATSLATVVVTVADPAPSPTTVTSVSSGFLSLRNDFAINPSMSASVLTTRIQNAFTSAISAGKGIDLGADLWPISSPLTIGGNLALRAAGAQEVWSTRANSTSTSAPGAAPWVKGGGLVQQSTGADILQINGTGPTVHIRDMVLSFGGSSTFTNTGHAINGMASALDGATGHENGPTGCRWDNIVVWGHDGSHYAYRLVNSNLNTLSHLRSYGGGGIYYQCDSTTSSFGNSVVIHPYIALMVGGTADGFTLNSAAAGFPGSLALILFLRPQANIMNMSGASVLGAAFPVLTTNQPSSANQQMWRDIGTMQDVQVISPDLEAPSSAFQYTFSSGTAVQWFGPGVTNNTIFGYGALKSGSNVTGTNDTAIGTNALAAVTSGNYNTAVGANAAPALTTGSNNTVVGQQAMPASQTDTANTAIGDSALKALRGGSYNVAIGAAAGYDYVSITHATVTGGSNTWVGQSAGPGDTSDPSNSVAVGQNAKVTAGFGTAVGSGTTATWVSVAVGYSSSATGNPGSIAIGYTAAASGQGAIAIGYGASATANGSVAIGRDSGGTAASTATANVIALGTASHQLQLKNNTTGAGSAALGANCPAVTVTAPYTWFRLMSSDGSTVYVPAWK